MSARFRRALEGLDHRNWQLFEEVAAKFMADEFDSLRTLADPSGDEARDGVLLSPADFPSIAVQYSVAKDSSGKIRATAQRLNETHPEVTNLIYLTPRDVSSKVYDTETTRLRKHHRINLDIRSASWFVDREDRSPSTRSAADLAGKRIVDPLLASAGLLENASPELSAEDTRSALFFLSMQREDDDRNRGLTRLCFDALVRAVLRRTDHEHLLSRQEIRDAVGRLVPSHDSDDVAEYTDRALARLERSAVRHYEKRDAFCLSYDERSRLVEGMVELQQLEASFDAQVRESLDFVVESMGSGRESLTDEHLQRVRRVLETYLFEQGESFVAALAAGQAPLFIDQDLKTAVEKDVIAHPDLTALRHSIVPIVDEAIRRTVQYPTDSTLAFLHAAKEAYTLFAFLKESPNVQAAVSKIFAEGELWLDTTVILPLLAEHLLDQEQRHYSHLFSVARQADVKLYTTMGVVEEINSHLDRCRAAIRWGSNFRGRSPFLLNAYVWSGRPLPLFGDFESVFRGTRHAEADVADYLKEELGIVVRSLSSELESADDTLRWAVQEYWRGAHTGRRSGSNSIDPELIERLAQHDTESFLGVIQRRGGELITNPLGYSTWWLTVDRSAVDAAEKIAEIEGIEHFDSPVIGLAFLTYYLLAGDARRQISREAVRTLPSILDTTFVDVMPKELMAAADKVRNSVADSNPRIMRRQIRDMLEAERIRSGKIGRVGIDAVQYDIEMSLKSS